MAAKSSSRGGTRIDLIVCHTNEGDNPPDQLPDRTAENLAIYLGRPDVQASYHKIVDDDSTVDYLPDAVMSWSVLSGNKRSLNLCFTGWARWTRSDWLAHDAMLQRGATEVREWCARHGIPAVRLTPAQVGAGFPGVCGHWDWTLGKAEGTHTDPGPGFPWATFMGYVTRTSPSPTAGPDTIALMEYGQTSEIIRRLQSWLNTMFPSYSHISPVSGYYGDQTTAVIREFQRRVGIVGGDGRNVGPVTRAKLYEHGFRG